MLGISLPNSYIEGKEEAICWTECLIYNQKDYFFHLFFTEYSSHMMLCTDLSLLCLNFLIYEMGKITNGTEDLKNIIMT